MFRLPNPMISIRRADLLERIKNQREKLTLIVVLYVSNGSNGSDHCSFWTYNDKGDMVNLSSYSNFLHNAILNAGQAVDLGRSFGVSFEDTINFSEDLPAFTTKTKATDNHRLQGLFSQTMQDFYIALKRSATAFVGQSEHHINDKGVCFGVIELFKPKFNVGEYAKFKNDEGDIVSGMIVGLDGGTAQYTISHDRIETDVPERDLLPSNMIGASLSFRKKADLLLNIQEKQRQKEEAEREADRIDKHPLDSLPEHPQISEMIKDTCESFGDQIQKKYETYGNEVNELPAQSSSGFHNYTNGGWSSNEYTMLDMMSGSGYWPGGDDFHKHTQEAAKEGYEQALESFINEHRDDLVKIGLDPSVKKNLKKINYHDLYKMEQGRLAESLSELESSALSEYQYDFYFKVFYYAPTNSNKDFEDGLPEVNVQSGIKGSYQITAVDERFSFSTLSQLREKLTSCLNQAVEALG